MNKDGNPYIKDEASKGGNAILEKYGSEYFRKLAKKRKRAKKKK